MIKVSIITVCFNTEDTIADTIKAIQAQTYSDIEHVIIDGGSTDRTLDIIKALIGDDVKIVSEPDHGIYDAMNKGIGISSGEVIGFLNSGDVFESSTIVESIVDEISKSNADACWGDLCYVACDNPAQIIRYWKSGKYKPGSFAVGWVPPHPTFYAKRNIYGKYGAFDLDYFLAADFEIMCRLIAKHRITTKYIPKVFVRMRLGGATNANIRNIWCQNVEILKALSKNGIKLSPRFFTSKMRSKISQYFKKGKINIVR
jgi:glycosyltransferase involved in cell wall biosynthesis